MRGVIKEHQTSTDCILEIYDVQGGGVLIQIITVAARIETQEGAEQETNRRFVRNDDDGLPLMLSDDVEPEVVNATTKDLRTPLHLTAIKGFCLFIAAVSCF